MVKTKAAAEQLLANRRIAVTRVSRNPQVHGDPWLPDLRSIPSGVGAVVIGTRPDHAEPTMREAVHLGITQVWMHRAFGVGQRLRRCDGKRAPARCHGDRWRQPAHVRPHGRHWAQGDVPAPLADRHGPPAGLTTTPGRQYAPVEPRGRSPMSIPASLARTQGERPQPAAGGRGRTDAPLSSVGVLPSRCPTAHT